MSHAETQHRIIACEPPLPEQLIHELVSFWQGVFQADYAPFRSILTGKERGQNRDVFYLVTRNGKSVGTCHLTISESNPELGGLGEVATAPECRGMGIASALCARARDDFRKHGGQALFLGTANPAAARVYHSLGWRKLAGANVMVFVATGRPPEGFLADYFTDGSAAAAVPGSAAERIPMIPLIVCPHDWQVMDANVGILSTRCVDQKSCMGLYPRYAALDRGGLGAWFSARTGRGRVSGLSSARLDGSGGCQVDGFTHPNYPDAWRSLLEAAISWGAARGAKPCWFRVSGEDQDKMSRCEALGFRKVRAAEPFELGARQVPSVRLERDT